MSKSRTSIGGTGGSGIKKRVAKSSRLSTDSSHATHSPTTMLEDGGEDAFEFPDSPEPASLPRTEKSVYARQLDFPHGKFGDDDEEEMDAGGLAVPSRKPSGQAAANPAANAKLTAVITAVKGGGLRKLGLAALGLFVLNAIITVALVGGPQEMKEVLEPNWQASLEWPPPGVEFVAGKTVLVTGANRGYGLAISQHLVGFGAKVIMHCRSAASCKHATDTVRKYVKLQGTVPGGTVEMVAADLSSPSSVVGMVGRLKARGVQLDTLILNAAVVDATAIKVPGGVNRMFMVNYLSNVVMVKEMMEAAILPMSIDDAARVNAGTGVPAGKRPRLVLVSSGTYYHGDNKNFGAVADWSVTEAMSRYGQTKFLLMSWAVHLNNVNPAIDVVTHSPGPIFTDLGKENVPLALFPTYSLMKLALFPQPIVASRPIVSLTIPSQFATGTYLHIRRDDTETVNPTIYQTETHMWIVQNTLDALGRLGYKSTTIVPTKRVVPDRFPDEPAKVEEEIPPPVMATPTLPPVTPPPTPPPTADLPAQPTPGGLEVAPIDDEHRAFATLGGLCIDTLGNKVNGAVGVWACHGSGGNQALSYTALKELKTEDGFCLDSWGSPLPAEIVLQPCHRHGGNQEWLLTRQGRVVHGAASASPGGCIDVLHAKGQQPSLRLETCVGEGGDSRHQEWLWRAPDLHADEL